MARSQIDVGHHRSKSVAAFLVALAVGIGSDAGANGAFPDEFSVSFPPLAPHRIYVGANFGLVISEDDGATWRYACEPWVTTGSNAALSGTNVSFYEVTADDAVLALAVAVTRSADDGCTWPYSGGVITGQTVEDLFPDPNDSTFVVGIVVIAGGSYLVASHDGGQTFVDPPLYQTDDLLTAVETSKSTPGVMYATSVPLSGAGAYLLRSPDWGTTWTNTLIPAPGGTQPLILTIDPADANTVYLRVVGALTDSIVVTTDGGQTFQTLITINGQFSSFIKAGDGTLYAGSLNGELYILPPGATAFTSQSGPHFRCLGQRPGSPRIYACGDMARDGFSLGYSDDDGGTFNRMMNFTEIQGPLTCAPVSDACVAHWTRIQEVLGIYDAGVIPSDGGTDGTDAGANPDAGSGPGPGSGPSGPKTGSCTTTPGEGLEGLALVGLIVLVWGVRRRTVGRARE